MNSASPSNEERQAATEDTAAVEARWATVLRETETVAFKDLAVGDVLVHGSRDGQRTEVLGEAEEFTDRFGRTLRHRWCRTLDGSGREGWVSYGPGGQTLRQRRPDTSTGGTVPGRSPEDRFRQTMDSIVRSGNSTSLAELVKHAAGLWPVLDGSQAMAGTPEAFRAVMYAAASAAHLDTLAGIARRAGQLWDGRDDDPRAAFVGCLPQHADRSAIAAALACARDAGAPLAVIGHDRRFGYGENGAQGLFIIHTGDRTVECQWFIDGRDNERGLSQARIRRVRPARNAALAEVRSLFSAAGWHVHDKASTNTATPRLHSIVATSAQ